MRKLIFLCLSLLTIGTLLNTKISQIHASEISIPSQIETLSARGPETGPDGENLFPGGGSGQNFINFINDPFTNWSSSIFSPWQGNPTLLNHRLTLPKNTSVSSIPINFSGNSRYKVTIGNLNGTLKFYIWDHATGLTLAEQTVIGNRSNISFNYTHINHWPATGSSVIALEGITDSETTSFRIDRYQ